MDTWNEYGKWVTKGDNKALAEARQQLIASCKAHGLIIVKDLPNEIKGNKERPVVAIKDRGVNMTKDYKKVKAYLAQELKDVKAKLKRMKIKDAVLPKFEESKHKRDKDGKFSSTGGGGKNTEESNTVSKPDIKSLAKSKNKKEVKKAAKAYWTYFLNGVDDLVDWAGEDEDLRYYAEDGDIDSMAEIMANSEGGRETAIEAIDEMEEDELNDISEHINDSAINDETTLEWWCKEALKYAKSRGKSGEEAKAEAMKYLENKYAGKVNSEFEKYISEHINDSAIKDYKIELMVNGKRIGIVNASSPSEAVNRYEREHPELKNKVDGILVVDAVYKILRDSISYDKAEAERLFGLGYSAREVAMKIKEYQSSSNHSEQMDLIKRLENHRKKFFEEMMAKRRAGRI